MFPIITENALDQTITRTFEPDFGTVLTETDDANGLTTTNSYDAFGRIDYISYPDGSYEDYYYHVVQGNHYITITASEQPTVTTYYDNFGRNKKVKKEATDVTIITETMYDNAGNVSAEYLPYYSTDTIKYSTIYTYDQARWYLSNQQNPDGTEKNFTKNGLTETVTDENNHTKTIIKDSLGRIKSVTEATTGTASYEYDIFDNLTKVTDPLGSETSISYDDLGRKISMDDPYMGLWEYDYDENGNLIYQVDGKGQETTMPNYDGLNRITQKNYIDDGTQVNYTYGEGRTGYYNARVLTTVTVNDGTTTLYNYDNMGRVANEQRTISGTDYLIDREYDLAGRIEYITYPDTGAGRTMYKYTYDPIGTLREVRENGAADYLVDFMDYNALGQVGSVSYKNNASIEYFYKEDGGYRLDNLVSYDGYGTVIQDLTYDFDNVGNIETITDLVNDVTHSFLYDGINRLTDAVATSSDPSRTYDQTFTYDLAGNIEEKTGIGGYTVMEWQDSQTHIKPKVVNFDDEVAGIASRNIEYNQDNKPTEITYAGGTTTYLSYDGEGNRIKKVQGSNAVTYVGDIYEVREGQALSYIYANGKKFVTLTGSDEYYTHADHLGSTTLTTDEDGNAIEEIGYLPFGAVLFRNDNSSGTWESAYKFTGQEHDSEFELYNYGARLYDTVMGRFITPDTIIPEPYNPQSLNRYVYCLNNPLRYNDPSGYTWEEWWRGLFGLFQQIFQNEQDEDTTITENPDGSFSLPEKRITERKYKSGGGVIIRMPIYQPQVVRKKIYPNVIKMPIEKDYNKLILDEAMKWKEGYGGENPRCNEWVQRLFEDAGAPLEDYKNANNFEDHAKLALTVAKAGVVIQLDKSGMGKPHGHVAIMINEKQFKSTNSKNTINIYTLESFYKEYKADLEKGLVIRYLEYKP